MVTCRNTVDSTDSREKWEEDGGGGVCRSFWSVHISHLMVEIVPRRSSRTLSLRRVPQPATSVVARGGEPLIWLAAGRGGAGCGLVEERPAGQARPNSYHADGIFLPR